MCFSNSLLMCPDLSLSSVDPHCVFLFDFFFFGLTRTEGYTPALVVAGNILDTVALMSA